MADKLMYISNNDAQIYPFRRLQLVVETLDAELYEPTNQNTIKVLIVVKQTN